MKLKDILNESNKDAFNRTLTREQKREIMDSVSKFNDFGAKVYKTGEISEMVEAIRNLTKGASQLALQETDGWFDSVTVKRDMKEISKSTQLFEKAAKEMSTLQQRLESVFEDIGHKLGKYYDISEALDPVGKEDGDIDNDGDEDESDEYLAKKRAAISKAIKNEIALAESYVVVDPRGNARPVGSKIQGDRFVKGKKGHYVILAKNAKAARRAIEKAGGNATSRKVQDIMYDLRNESTISEGFSTWNVQFSKMNLSGVQLDPKKVYKVKARNTVEAIKKAAKSAGVGDSWVATETEKIVKVG